MNKQAGTCMISWDFTQGGEDRGVLIVGVKPDKAPIKIINAFQGADAAALRDLIIERKPNATNKA